MKLRIENNQHVYFNKGYIHGVLFKLTDDNFDDWINELLIYTK